MLKIHSITDLNTIIGFNFLKSVFLSRRQNRQAKNILSDKKFLSEDSSYIRYFKSCISPLLYQSHVNDYFICCAFCSNLYRTLCHNYCFSCLKKTHKKCSPLLPGTYTFGDSNFDTMENDFVPWIFKTPCTDFERLPEGKYFRNFNSLIPSITVANYEALEGIYIGISHGSRPCHICAAVNINIFNKCSKDETEIEKKPCDKILKEISEIFNTSAGMIKYVD